MKLKFTPENQWVLPALIFVADIDPAYAAYLDPGTGSFLLQMLMGGVAGCLVVVKLYWGYIKAWFSPRTARQSSMSVDDEELDGA